MAYVTPEPELQMTVTDTQFAQMPPLHGKMSSSESSDSSVSSESIELISQNRKNDNAYKLTMRKRMTRSKGRTRISRTMFHE
jgi:hypothetical protein